MPLSIDWTSRLKNLIGHTMQTFNKRYFYRLVPILIVLCLPLGSGLAEESSANRHTSPDHLFSFVPPKGWQSKDMPGMKYKVFYIQPAGGFAPNLNVVDEDADIPLKDYVAATERFLTNASKGYKKLSEEPFTTNDNLKGFRRKFKNSYEGKKLLQTQYYFSASKKKIIVTCTMAEAESRDFFAQCEEAMKTFRVHGGE